MTLQHVPHSDTRQTSSRDEETRGATESIRTDEIEDVLLHVSTTPSPDQDGIDYAIYKKFQLQLAPVLHEAFSFCWRHQRIPADQTRRLNKQLFVVWYDLKNAFGSIPQDLSVEDSRVHGRLFGLRRLARTINTDSVIANPAEGPPTEPILQSHGVYQGCPISPYLFLAATSFATTCTRIAPRWSTARAECCANCDRHCRRSQSMQLNRRRNPASTCDGHAVPQMVYARSQPRQVHISLAASAGERGENCSLSLSRDRRLSNPAFRPNNSYKYLGVGDGINHPRREFHRDGSLAQMRKEMHALFTSNLVPWQVFSALKTDIHPQVEYALS